MISALPYGSVDLLVRTRFKFKAHAGPNWPRLLPDSLHVWSVELDLPEGLLEGALRDLSRDEKERAENFRFPQHRNRFIAGRYMLRSILGRYVREPPRNLEFEYPDAGKPELIFPLRSGIQFNLSHSGDVGLLALAYKEVGVDLEHIRPIPEHIQIAKCFFAEPETMELLAQPENERPRTFYRIWTRKEALLKGWGCGITQNLKAFQVSAEIDTAEVLTQCRPDLRSSWKIHHLEPAEEFAGAVAINSEESQPECFHFEPGKIPGDAYP